MKKVEGKKWFGGHFGPKFLGDFWVRFSFFFCNFDDLSKHWPAANPRYIKSCLRAYEARIWHVTHIICHQIGKCHTVQNKTKIIFWHVKYNFDKVTLYWVSKNQTDRATNVSRGIWKYKRYSKFPKFPDLGAKLALLKVTVFDKMTFWSFEAMNSGDFRWIVLDIIRSAERFLTSNHLYFPKFGPLPV